MKNTKMVIVFTSIIISMSSVLLFTNMTMSSEILATSNDNGLVHTIYAAMEDVPLWILVEEANYSIVGEVISTSPVVYVNPELAERKRLLVSNGVTDRIIYDREILTDVTIRVEEDLFKKYKGSTITVRVPGGEIPGYKTIYNAAPEFTVGERVSIFVGTGQSYSISSDNYVVLGLHQGTIKMNDIASSKYANSTTTEQQIKDKIKALKSAEM